MYQQCGLYSEQHLKVHADKIHNLHFIPHPLFSYTDVLDFEQSTQCSLIARDGLHLSYKGCQMVCKNILATIASIPPSASPTSRPTVPPSPRPAPSSSQKPSASSPKTCTLAVFRSCTSRITTASSSQPSLPSWIFHQSLLISQCFTVMQYALL